MPVSPLTSRCGREEKTKAKRIEIEKYATLSAGLEAGNWRYRNRNDHTEGQTRL